MGNANSAMDSTAQILLLAIVRLDVGVQEQISSAQHARIQALAIQYLTAAADIHAILRKRHASGATIPPRAMRLMHAAQDMGVWMGNASHVKIPNALIQLHATALRDAVAPAQTKIAMHV